MAHVTGIAAGNELGQAGTFTGATPGAEIIFVNFRLQPGEISAADSAGVADAFQYIFARAAQFGRPCVVNLSFGEHQGPHDGKTLGERFLDGLLLTPGRAIAIAAGNSNNTGSHAAGNVAPPPAVGPPAPTNLALNYTAGADSNDTLEIWYDGHDRFTATVTVPTAPATVVGPVTPGTSPPPVTLPNGVKVKVTSVVNDPRNTDNLIQIIITVPFLPLGTFIPPGDWIITLTAAPTVINGRFQAWVDVTNQSFSSWQPPHLQEDLLTLEVPGTALRAITVGNHDKTLLPAAPGIWSTSGRGPTRDGRIKPEIATIGTDVTAPRSRNMNAAAPGDLYRVGTGTSQAAPLVAGACALLFECRGAGGTWQNLTWATLKQILEDTAGTGGLGAFPRNDFGFGYLQMANACAPPLPNVDVWLRDDPTDTGVEPFAGQVAWQSPDIEVLDSQGNAVSNPTHNPNKRFNNIIRVTVRNRGTQTARNTEIYLYWADPATNIPYPLEWRGTGIFTGAPIFVTEGNKIVIPQLAAGSSAQVEFAWAPPAPGSNLRQDDHFCLIVQLENEIDPSRVGLGGFSSVWERNNIALRNVSVQTVAPFIGEEVNATSFFVVGSPDQDSLIVYQELLGGRVELSLPVQALPWRDIRVIEQRGRRRLPYGCDEDDPLVNEELTLEGDEVQQRTDIEGAERLELRGGIATILAAEENQVMFVPQVCLAQGAKMPASIRVHRPDLGKEERFVHVGQLSGGQRVGGVTLELRPR